METQRGEGMLCFHPHFDIRHNYDGRVVSYTRRPHLTLKKIPWYSFLLEAKWTPVLLNADRRIRSVEHFQGPHQESKLRPPALWRITLYTRVILILNVSANWRIVANHNPSHVATGEEHGYPLNRRLNVLCI